MKDKDSEIARERHAGLEHDRAGVDRRGLLRVVGRAGVASLLLAGAGAPAPASAQTGGGSAGCVEDTLDKIKRTGVFQLGARQSTPPYGYVDAQNNWVGFATDIAKAIHANLEKELKTSIKLNYVAVTSQTRIPLLQNGTIDMEAGATVITRGRAKIVDFTAAHFLTSTEIIVPANSPIKTVADLAGKRLGIPQGGLEDLLYKSLNQRGRVPSAIGLVGYPDHPQGFTALQTGAIDAYSSDGPIVFGMKTKAQDPSRWRVFDPGLNTFLQAFPIRPESSRFKSIADATIVEFCATGGWSQLYDKYFGPHSDTPFEKTPALAMLELMNSWPES